MTTAVKQLSFQFAIKIIKLCNRLNKSSSINRAILIQLLKSGTSIGANIEEASAAQSRRDFLTKMYIAFKEAKETNYWLRLFKEAKLISHTELDDLLKESNSLINILAAITKSTKNNL